MIKYNNKYYEDLAQIAEEYNIPLNIFYNRLDYG
ncbi:MAG: LarC family nickel insertion protein [Clostridium beijerinckii]|nr:LarC family nickel insertion protein [Clostridium beijerinckii]